jgi:hypothetical protein
VRACFVPCWLGGSGSSDGACCWQCMPAQPRQARAPRTSALNPPTLTTLHRQQVCAAKGLEVLVHDRSKELLEHGLTNIKRSLKRLTHKGQMSQPEADEALGRIKTDTSLEVRRARAYRRAACVRGWSARKMPHGCLPPPPPSPAAATCACFPVFARTLACMHPHTCRPHRA